MELFADAEFDIAFEILGIYKDVWKATFYLFDIYPYRQVITYTDPFAVITGAAGFDVQTVGEYELHFLEIDIGNTQQAM